METIRASDQEIEIALHIAVSTAPKYVMRAVFERKLNRERAIETIVQRVFAALRRYELRREPKLEEVARGPLPLFEADADSTPSLSERQNSRATMARHPRTNQ